MKIPTKIKGPAPLSLTPPAKPAVTVNTPLLAFIQSPEQVPECVWLRVPVVGEICPFTGLGRDALLDLFGIIPFVPPDEEAPGNRMFNLRAFVTYWMGDAT